MYLLSNLFHTIKQGAAYGFAGYGAGVIYGANPALAAKVAAAYALGTNIILVGLREYSPRQGYEYVNNISLGCDAVAIVAARSLNLVGNKGAALLGTLAALRFGLQYYYESQRI